MTKLIDRVRGGDDETDTSAYTPTAPEHRPWAPERKYANFGLVTTVLELIAALALVGGVIGALLALFGGRTSDTTVAGVWCVSGLFGVGLFGALSIGLKILRDISTAQYRTMLEARRTAEAMERIANRQRGG